MSGRTRGNVRITFREHKIRAGEPLASKFPLDRKSSLEAANPPPKTVNLQDGDTRRFGQLELELPGETTTRAISRAKHLVVNGQPQTAPIWSDLALKGSNLEGVSNLGVRGYNLGAAVTTPDHPRKLGARPNPQT
eukprot:1191703-Prorocentrum_minimum.AAC.3